MLKVDTGADDLYYSMHMPKSLVPLGLGCLFFYSLTIKKQNDKIFVCKFSKND